MEQICPCMLANAGRIESLRLRHGVETMVFPFKLATYL